MEPWLDDLADDLQSLSFTSTATTTTTATTADINRSTSSGSEATLAASSGPLTSTTAKPHAPSSDPCWSAIHRIRSESPALQLGLSDIRFAVRLGSGDIGSVYLAQLKSSDGCLFAAKVMDKKELASRSKEGRARTEREILEMLDHPFLPTLYASIDAPRWLCLLTEFCPGGDLHVLRQRQPSKRFPESTVRCARY
jgi:protein-serine/threonine kinase